MRLPSAIAGSRYRSLDRLTVERLGGGCVAELTATPFVKALEALRDPDERLRDLQRIPSEELFAAFRAAAALLRSPQWTFADIDRDRYRELVAASTGLPLATLAEELDELATCLDDLGAIANVQQPAPSAIDDRGYRGRGAEIGLYPAGRTLLVRVPGNVPTIASYWLVPLALKRPVIVVPPLEDPFTHWVLWEAIHAVAPWLARHIHLVPCTEDVFARLLPHVDQIVMSQAHAALVERAPSLVRKTELIHYGHSKLAIVGEWDDALVDVAARRMLWKHGRTCTSISSIVVTERASELGRALADRVGTAGEQATFDGERAGKLDALVESFVRSGEARDVTRELRGTPRLVCVGGRATLAPTVLDVARDRSRVLGLELPFPFVTVVEARDEARVLELCRDTLILSVAGAGDELVERLCYEPSIRKVFAGEYLERGYHALDPHEGYPIDTLYHRKAVLPAWRARRSMPR